jgi:hypothetical protein
MIFIRFKSFAPCFYRPDRPGFIASGVRELTRVAIVGGKVNWSSVAIGGISGGIYGYGEGLAKQAKIKANILNQSSAFTGERINVAGGVGRTDAPVGEKRDSVQQDLLSTNPSEGGLSIKAGAADSVKKQAENLNAVNSKTNLAGLDQAISNIAADAVGQYYYEEQAKAMGYAMDAAAKSERMAYRLAEDKRLNLVTPATDRGESFRQSGLKPYVSGASISNWDVAGDRAAALQSERTRSGVALGASGPITLAAVAVASPALATTTGIGGLTGFGFDAGAQYVKTGGFKNGDFRLGQSLFSGFTGAIFAPLAVEATLLGNISLGSTVNVMNTKFNNTVYKENNSLVNAAAAGGFAVLGGKLLGGSVTSRLENYMLFNSLNTTARQINYISNTAGNATSTTFSGTVTPLAQDQLDKLTNNKP